MIKNNKVCKGAEGNLVVGVNLDMSKIERTLSDIRYAMRSIDEEMQSRVIEGRVVRRKIDGKEVVLRSSWERDEVED